MRRLYVDGPFGQVHVRLLEPPTAGSDAPVLICLHPAPSSGLYLETLMSELALRGVRAAAPDYPGYGGSDAGPPAPSIADYAAAVWAVADAVSPNRAVDFMGFHTGCLVACEAALQVPDRSGRLALIDVPFFEGDKGAELATKMGARKALSWDLNEALGDAWSFSVAQRRDQISLDRAYELFVEQARGGRAMNAAFAAAFSYPCRERLSALSAPSTVIATQSMLLEPTRVAAKVIPGASLVERPDVTKAALELGASALAEEVARALGSERGGS